MSVVCHRNSNHRENLIRQCIRVREQMNSPQYFWIIVIFRVEGRIEICREATCKGCKYSSDLTQDGLPLKSDRRRAGIMCVYLLKTKRCCEQFFDYGNILEPG